MAEGRDRRTATGRQGEELAVAYLAEQGYAVVSRNWRTRAGEIDVIAQDGLCLVFVEVRTRIVPASADVRRSAVAPTQEAGLASQGDLRHRPLGQDVAFGHPEESVTGRKQHQLVAMAEAYLFQADWRGPWRVDVVGVELRRDGALARLVHFRDAVQG